jgi:hypothetical protein
VLHTAVSKPQIVRSIADLRTIAVYPATVRKYCGAHGRATEDGCADPHAVTAVIPITAMISITAAMICITSVNSSIAPVNSASSDAAVID